MARRKPVPGQRHAHNDLRHVAAAVLRVAQLARRRGEPRPGRLTVPNKRCPPPTPWCSPSTSKGTRWCRRRPASRAVEQIGYPEVDGRLDGVYVGFQEVHGPVEMLSFQVLGSLDAHVLAQPLINAVERRAGRQGGWPPGRIGRAPSRTRTCAPSPPASMTSAIPKWRQSCPSTKRSPFPR